MISIRKLAMMLVLSLIIAIPLFSDAVHAFTNEPSVNITDWEMKWEEINSSVLEEQGALSIKEETGWFPVSYGDSLLEKPTGVKYAWIRFQLPELNWVRPTLLLNKLNAKDIKIYIDQGIVYETKRNYLRDNNKVLLPLSDTESNKMLYMKLETSGNVIGVKSEPIIGEYQHINSGYIKRDILDVILGASLIIISLAVQITMLFLNKKFLLGWYSLCFIMLSLGVMIVTYSPFLHTTYSEYGAAYYVMFDVASNLLMPSIYLFFEKVFGKGPYGVIAHFRKLQIILAIFSFLLLIGSLNSDVIKEWYGIVGVICFGLSIIVGNILLIACLIMYCRQGNQDAIILAIGFGLFAVIGLAEVTWFFIQERGYELFIWKWGLLCFIVSLVVILASRLLQSYEQQVKYSQQLEVFNNELQRSEKMEIISQLAASVAHEVRNPLQVTRGFLQLLGAKTSNEKDKGYMVLAIDELDRASEIITDFLTFAKPQLEQMTSLNIAAELKQIEGILIPLATMQGGIIEVELSDDLYVNGNSSKLKQALINIIKNSIEALGDEGLIQIQAYEDKQLNEVVIHIKDNGEGIGEADLKRLGEPYYSKKTKGTGLGLMVTYRIIEAMKGRIVFKSIKGVGTEAILSFPSITE